MKKEQILLNAKNVFDYYGIKKEKQPLILHGNLAKKFYIEYWVKKGFSHTEANKEMKRVNGIFLYEGIEEKDLLEYSQYMRENGFSQDCYKNGVICLIRNRFTTLAHEIRHSYQLNSVDFDGLMMINQDHSLCYLYHVLYVYYPTEQDAFFKTWEYLKSQDKKVSFVYMMKIMQLEFKYLFKTKEFKKFTNGFTVHLLKNLFRSKKEDFNLKFKDNLRKFQEKDLNY